MLRKITIALAAALTLGAAAMPTEASASWRGHHRHHHYHHGWRAPAVGFYYGAPVYPTCYRTVRVMTPWGPSLRRVWVCG
jgi:hypothetical protein